MIDRLKQVWKDFKVDKLLKVPLRKVLIGAYFNIVWVLRGGSNENRMIICRSCPLNNGNFCEGCTCYIPSKTALIDERCPIGKW